MNLQKISEIKKTKVIIDQSLLSAIAFNNVTIKNIYDKSAFNIFCGDVYDAAYGSGTESSEFKNFVVSGLTTKQIGELMGRFCTDDKVLILPIFLSWEDKKEIVEKLTGRTDLNCFINTENPLSLINATRDITDPETVKAIKETLLIRNDEISGLKQIIGTEPVKTSDVHKIMLQTGYVHSLSTAIRKTDYFLDEGILLRVSDEQRDFYVRINENW